MSLNWPIAVALHVKNLSFVDEPVNNRVGNGVIRKDLVELPEGDVGGRYRPQLRIMSGANHLEEQIACLSVQRHVSQLVNNQHLRFSVFIKLRFQVVGFLRVLKMIDHLRSRNEQDRDSLLAARISQRSRQMGLAGPRVPGKNRGREIVLSQSGHEREINFFNLLGRLGVSEVEVLHRLKSAESSTPDPVLNHLRMALRFLLGYPIRETP